MLTVNWFLQECTILESCTIGIRIHVYDQSRLYSFRAGHNPLTKRDVLPVITSENSCFGFILRLLKTCAQFKIAFLMWNLTLTLTYHLHPKLWINDPDGITFCNKNVIQFVRKFLNSFLFILFLYALIVFNTPFFTFSCFYICHFTSLFYYIISTYGKFLSSLCLIMTVERSKRRFLIPLVFITKCFKKPLLLKPELR